MVVLPEDTDAIGGGEAIPILAVPWVELEAAVIVLVLGRGCGFFMADTSG